MVTHGPSGVPSRLGLRLGDQVERFKRSKIVAYNANAYQRRVARSLWRVPAGRH
jgi:hypothetical protein